MPQIELNNVTFGYQSKPLFSDLSVRIDDGFTALIGPNGSGKSSLLRLIAGLDSPEKGAVSVCGAPLGRLSARGMAKVRAFMPQQTITPEAMNVRQLVGCGRYAHRGWLSRAGHEDQDAIDWALDVCGMSAFQNTQIDSLSGGERQRAWLASALSQRAPILLLDEPCSYLDILHQLELMQVLRDLVDHEGLTVVMSSHDIGQAVQYADHIIAMEDGALIAHGLAECTLTSDLIQNVFGVRAEFHTSALTGKRHCMLHAAVKPASHKPATFVHDKS